jgi:signal transduction histidine kinase
MKRRRRSVWQVLRGLRAQLLLWAILPLTLALIAVALTGVYGHERTMRQMVEERDLLLAQAYAPQVAQVLAMQGPSPPAEAWANLLGDIHLAQRGVIYLIDGNGRIIWHPVATLCGVDYSGHSGIFQALNNPAGATSCQAPDGSPMYLSYASVGNTGWRVVVEEPLDDLTDPLLRLPGLVPFVAAVAGLVAVLALTFGARTIVVPLRRLVRAAGRVSWGDLSAIAEPVSGVEEIEDLQQALQEMAGRIQSYEEGMRDYLGAVTEAQEGERARLARELHDETVQALVALGQRVEMAKRALERGGTERARALLEEVRRLSAETMEGVRRFSQDLRPLYLEDLGFVPALEMLAREAGRHGQVVVEVRVEGTPRRLAPAHELALYRIAQEALNNAIKHAQAQRIWLNLRFDEAGATLTVADGGVGFKVPERPDRLTQEGHFGLLGMRERALLAGGELRVGSYPGQGTTITVRIPGQELTANPTARTQSQEDST